MARQMKDSGIEWIDSIPVDWQTIKLCYVTDAIFLGKTPVYSEDGNKNYTLGQRNNQQYGLDFTGIKYSTDEHFASCNEHEFLKYGDVLLNSLGTGSVGRIGFFDITDKKVLTDGHIIVIRPNEKIDAKHLFYYLRTLRTKFEDDAVGSTNQAFLTVPKVYKTPIPFPPLVEQHRIAEFLDRQCAEIDAVIERTKATIEEYKKLKQAVITEAVTKGVRGARKMKDSGIEWLGIIPDAWDCTKLKQVWISVDSGVSVNAADYPTENDSQYGVLKTSCVSKFVFLPNEHKQVDADEYARVACPVKKDTIIVSRMNTPDLVGACGYVDADYPNLFLPDRLWQISFFPEVSAKFVWYYLNNQMVRAYISSLSTGTSSSMQNISKPQFGGITLAVPTIEEQNEIVHYLDEKCAALDTLIAKKTALLTELETYKKSLIYEYVTGKKEVV